MTDMRWQDHFEPGETLLWQGAPAPGLQVTPLMVLLSLLGLAFLVVGVMTVAEGVAQMARADAGRAAGFGLFLTLFGLPFALAGLGLTAGPWYAASKAHRKVRYALSDRRAYVATSWWNDRLESYPIGPVDPVELQRGRTDTVWFSTVESRDSEGGPVRQRTGFHRLADGRAVYDLLRRIQRERA